MGHTIFQDAPSKDMTKAQERQEQLDAQIEAFLAKGGEIKAYDNHCRPVEPGKWSDFSIKPRPLAPVAAPKPQPSSEPEQLGEVVEASVPASEVLQETQETAAAAVAEVVIATIPVPSSMSTSTDDAWKRLRKDIAAARRRLDSLGKKVARA